MVRESTVSIRQDTDIRESDIFISYDFEDFAFVQKLQEAIGSQKLQVWNNLPIGVSPHAPEAWQHFASGIQSSHIFVFVISPASVLSAKNQNELTLAKKSGKYLIPICCREVSQDALLDELPDRAEWFEVDLLELTPFESIAKRIHQLHIYIRLADRAEKWLGESRPNNLLLGKKDLESINDWEKQAVDKRLSLTTEQKEYLKLSRELSHDAEEQQIRLPDVLISYSRKDKEFVQRLCAALKDNNISYWVDWENIPVAAPWREELAEGIRNASNFLFVVSHDSVTSKYCYDEIRQAASHNKRIISFVYRRDFDTKQVHPDAKELNWLHLDEFPTEEEALSELLEAIRRDEEYVKFHRNLELQAFEWDGKDNKNDRNGNNHDGKHRRRRDAELLLTGSKLKKAVQWLAQSGEKDPPPTELQREFIKASQDKENQSKFVIASVIGLTLAGAALLTSVLFATTAGQINALVSALDSKQELDGLKVSLEAGKNFLGFHGLTGWLINQVDPSTRAKVVTALNQSVYDLHETNRLEGHTDRVYRAIFSHDGSLIASASQDGTVRLWKPDGTLLRTLTGHLDGVSSIDFSPDDQLLASSSNDGTVKLWNVKAAQTKDRNPLVRTFSGHSAAVFGVQFSSDGQMIASASQDGTVRLWTPAGIEKAVLTHGSPVYNLSFSPDGQQLVSAGDGGVRLWNSTDHFKTSKRLSDQAALSVTFSPDGSRVVVSELNGNNIRLWNNQGTLLATMTEHQDKVNRVVFSPNNQWIASVSKDNTVRLWDREGKSLKVLRGHQASLLRVQFNPDGRMLATAGADGIINLWNMDGTLIDSLKRHKNDIWDINFSPDGKLLASAGADNTVKLWRPESSFIQRLPNDNYALDINFSPNQKFIAASSYYTIQFWTAKGQRAGQIPIAHQGAVQSISTSPDSQLLASAGEDGKVKLWTLTWQDTFLRKATPLRLPVPTNSRSSHTTVVAFSPDGQQLASTVDGFVQLWRRGRTVMNGSINFNLPKQMEGNRGVVNSITFSRNGQLLAAGSSKISPAKPFGEVLLWRKDGTLIRRFEAYDKQPLGDIFSVSLSPDSHFLAAADSDNTIKIWKLIYKKSDDKLVDVVPFKILEGHTGSVLKVAYSPNGKLLASASQDGMIKLWDTANGGLISTLKNHEAPVSSLSFSSDSQMLVSGGYDTKALLWQIPDNFDREALNNLLHEGCGALGNYLKTNQSPDLESQGQREALRKFCIEQN